MKKELDEEVFDTYTKESCYWAGFLAADGCIDVNNTIRIELAGKDKEHVTLFKEFCKSDHTISHNELKDSYKVGFSSKYMKDSLFFNFSLTVDKTHNLIYPLLEETWQYAAYLRGFFDGDGCFSQFFNNRPKASFRVFLTNGSLQYLENLLGHLRSLSIIKGGSIQKKASNCWHIQLGIQDSTSFLNWIYSIEGPKLTRKYLMYEDIIVNGNRMTR